MENHRSIFQASTSHSAEKVCPWDTDGLHVNQTATWIVILVTAKYHLHHPPGALNYMWSHISSIVLEREPVQYLSGNIIKDIQQLSHAWNIQLLKPVEDDNIHLENDDNEDDDDPDNDDDDNIPPMSKDYDYFKSGSFKKYIKSKFSSIKEIISKAKCIPEE